MNEIDSSNSKAGTSTNRQRPSTVEELFRAMVHDLRTPITVINGYATLLADEKYKQLHAQAIENILSATKKLEAMLNNSMDDYQSLTEKSES